MKISFFILFGLLPSLSFAAALDAGAVKSGVPGAPLDPKLVAAYFSAAKTGDIPGLDSALAAGMPIDFQDQITELGQTALLTAAAYQQPVAVAHLLAKGADVSARDNLDATAVIYGAINRDMATMDAVLAAPGADLMALDMRLRSAFDYAREAGDRKIVDRLERKLGALDCSDKPEHYLVVNFLGFGGGGRVDVKRDARIAGIVHARRGGDQYRQTQDLVERWMSFERSQGGPRWQSLILAGSSWGAGPSIQLAQWFFKRYGFPARLHILIDGANILGFPVGAIGPADIRKNYHAEGVHWPRGGEVTGADNVSLGSMDHNSGLFEGSIRASRDIAELLAQKLVPRPRPK